MSKELYVDKSIAEGRRKQAYPFLIYTCPHAKRAKVRLSDEDAQSLLDWHREDPVQPGTNHAARMKASRKMPTHRLIEENENGSVLRTLAPWPGLSEQQERACRDLERALMKCELAGVVIVVMGTEVLATPEETMQRVNDVMVKSMLQGHEELYKATHSPFGRKLDDHDRVGWHGDW